MADNQEIHKERQEVEQAIEDFARKVRSERCELEQRVRKIFTSMGYLSEFAPLAERWRSDQLEKLDSIYKPCQ